MADDKKSGGLDDLKARLGLDSVLSKAKRTEAKPVPPPTGPGGAEQASSPPPSPAQQASKAAAPARRRPSADYSAAVSTFEEPAAGEGEPEPVYSGLHDAIDPNISAPISPITRYAFIGATTAGVLLALLAGFLFGKAMRERVVSNQVIDASEALLHQIEPVANQLQEFIGALSQFDNEYSPELHQLIVDTYEGSGPVVSSRTLADGRIIMTRGEDLARELINYALSTQILQALAQEHLRKTVRDFHLIQRLLSGDQEPQNYAVIFDSDELIRNFRNYFENPDENPYFPTQGFVVTYDELNVDVEGEEENRTFKYDVMAGGQNMQVDIYNVLTIDADQLVSNPNEETALDRYRGRVSNLRDRVEQTVRMQDELLGLLRERANASRSFTL